MVDKQNTYRGKLVIIVDSFSSVNRRCVKRAKIGDKTTKNGRNV